MARRRFPTRPARHIIGALRRKLTMAGRHSSLPTRRARTAHSSLNRLADRSTGDPHGNRAPDHLLQATRTLSSHQPASQQRPAQSMRGWHTVPLTPTPQHGQHDAPPITQPQLHPYTLHQPGSQRLSHQPGQHSLRQAGQTKTAARHSPLVPPPLANTTTPASAANAKRSLPATPPKPRTQGHAAAKVTPPKPASASTTQASR